MSYLLVRCIILAFALSSSALGTVYKWVDAEGQVHYSDQPPADVQEVEVFEIPAQRLEIGPTVPTPSTSSAEELERIRQLTGELEKDRKIREAERAALEEQRRRESSANLEREQEAQAQRGSELELYYPYPYPAPYGCCPFSPPRCSLRHTTSCCLLYPWTCHTIQPLPLLPSPPALRSPWRPEPPRRRPPQRPLQRPGSPSTWKNLPSER